MNKILSDTLRECSAVVASLSGFENDLERAAELLTNCLRSGNKLLTCGNGGSASDAAHFATEFVSRFMTEREPYPAIALTGDGGLLTALGNDYSFEEIFARQVRAFGKPGDVLVAFTSSGQSRNVVRAIEEAQARDVQSIVFLGKGGGFTKGLATIEFLVQSNSTARVQEGQHVLFHVLCEMVDKSLIATASS